MGASPTEGCAVCDVVGGMVGPRRVDRGDGPMGIMDAPGAAQSPPHRVSLQARRWRCTTRVQTIDWDGKLHSGRIRS